MMMAPTVGIMVGGCPAGGGAHCIVEDFTPCGICLGIVFFPIGLLCCMVMRERRCTKCGANFG